MLTVSELYIYPIKSLGGISAGSALVTSRGLQYDRRWLLIDSNNRFLTQREYPEMALLQPGLTTDGLIVHQKKNEAESIFIPHALPPATKTVTVQIWDDVCEAKLASNEIHKWFSAALNKQCRLVYMPDTTARMVDKKYAANNEITSFSDAYPVLIIGQSSLDEVNSRLTDPLPINRFRPNIVFTGAKPFEEDTMEEFEINGIGFFGVQLCARCVVTTINQDEATKGKEPLKTLASYRMKGNKIYFGQNLLHMGEGVITVGDAIKIKKTKAGFSRN